MNCETKKHLNLDLGTLLDEAIVKQAEGDIRDYSHFHPSEFDQCHRKLVYKHYDFLGIIQLNFPDNPVGPQLQRIFDNGHHVHYRLGGNLKRTGLLKGRWECAYAHYPGHSGSGVYGIEEKLGIHCPPKCECGCNKFRYKEVGFLDKNTLIGGHVDGVLDLRGHVVDGTKISDDAPLVESHMIVDFKSMRSEAFRVLAAPKPGHISQMQIYLFLSGLTYGLFLYENKNTQEFKQFLVIRDDPFIEARVEEAKALKKIVTEKNSKGAHTLPPRPKRLKKNSKECMDCKYRAHCWGLNK